MNKIKFILNGCDISFIAEAPEDITLKQLLKQRDYLYKKINGHGAAFTEDSYGKLHCCWIYGKNKFQIMLINVHLWFIRFVERLKGTNND